MHTRVRTVLSMLREVSVVIHNAFAGVGSDVLQPSHVNVLKQLVGAEVGLIRVRRAVETDHDAVKRHLSGNLCADAGLKIRMCRPGIKLRIQEINVS